MAMMYPPSGRRQRPLSFWNPALFSTAAGWAVFASFTECVTEEIDGDFKRHEISTTRTTMALPKKNNGKSRARRLAAGVFPSLLPGLFRCRLLIGLCADGKRLLRFADSRRLTAIFYSVHDRSFPHCARSDDARFRRFCGCTRIGPPRGLSISAIRKNAVAAISGRISNNLDSRCASLAPKPTSALEQIAIATISPQAASGMRFHHAA